MKDKVGGLLGSWRGRWLDCLIYLWFSSVAVTAHWNSAVEYSTAASSTLCSIYKKILSNKF